MHIVITGGAGFIGHHAVWRALERGWTVSVLDNFSTGKLENLVLPSDRIPAGLTIYECDIAEGPLPDIKDIDYLLHLAAPVSVEESISNPEKYYKGISLASRRIFTWAKERSCTNIVAASTAAIYGDSEDVPFSETTQVDPMSPYAENKLEMESILKDYHSKTLNCTALRFFNVFGESQPDDVGYVSAIPIFKKQYEAYSPITVTGDGLQTRDFVYVEDVVDVCYRVMESPVNSMKLSDMGIFNIGSGEETQILDIAEAFGGEIVHVDPREEQKRALADISLIRTYTNWKPTMNVLEWIKEQKNA